MKKYEIKDPEYIAYIEQLPCFKCGHVPTGQRKIYNEYLDEYIYMPCKNTAHHVDNTMTRTKNDHRVLPACGHYVVSGRGTQDCHSKEHSNAECKTKEYRDKQVILADKYYEEYISQYRDIEEE